MQIKATLLPGQNGTKQLLNQYGDKLVCVRYRYDKTRRKKFKTIELIIEERDWIIDTPVQPEQTVLIKVAYEEEKLREQVKAAGGSWEPEAKAWRLPLKKVIELKLGGRIQPSDAPR